MQSVRAGNSTMAFVKLVVPILVLVVAIVQVALQEKWRKSHDRRTKLHSRIIGSLIVLMCLGTVATCLSIWFDTKETTSLRVNIAQLQQAGQIEGALRDQKIQLVAQRARSIQSEGNAFLLPFLGGHGRQDLIDHFNIHYRGEHKKPYTPKEMQKELQALFLISTMLEPSHVFVSGGDSKRVPVTQLNYFHFQMKKAFSETQSILQHYGDVDHHLIKLVDDLGSRSKMFVQIIPLLSSIEGGVRGVFGQGVPLQYAEFFSYYFMTQYESKLLCDKILNNTINNTMQPIR